MKVVFMGTPDIARVCLQKLLSEGVSVVAVYTKPDTPKNRGMKMTMSPVKELALEHGIAVYQPLSFKEDSVYEEMLALAPDLVVTVAYGKILPQRFLDIPQYGCVNMHASILPQLRGAGPVQWSILNHHEETGVTAMYMSRGMDEGDIIEIRKTPIDPMETSMELMERLSYIAADLAVDTVRSIQNGTVSRTPQNHAEATYAPMLSKELSPIDWNQSAKYVIDQVRGLIPWPVATMMVQDKLFKVFRVEKEDKTTNREAGTLLALTKKGLEVACGTGEVVTVTQLQAEGGKRMAAADYFRGHPITL